MWMIAHANYIVKLKAHTPHTDTHSNPIRCALQYSMSTCVGGRCTTKLMYDLTELCKSVDMNDRGFRCITDNPLLCGNECWNRKKQTVPMWWWWRRRRRWHSSSCKCRSIYFILHATREWKRNSFQSDNIVDFCTAEAPIPFFGRGLWRLVQINM